MSGCRAGRLGFGEVGVGVGEELGGASGAAVSERVRETRERESV